VAPPPKPEYRRPSGGSCMLDQVMDHKRTTELCKSALGEVAEVYSREAKLTREAGHLRVCLCVVTRQKDDAISTVRNRIRRQHGGFRNARFRYSKISNLTAETIRLSMGQCQ
jgi:hypothetical protein